MALTCTIELIDMQTVKTDSLSALQELENYSTCTKTSDILGCTCDTSEDMDANGSILNGSWTHI